MGMVWTRIVQSLKESRLSKRRKVATSLLGLKKSARLSEADMMALIRSLKGR